jgi:hypothetical protein
MGKDRKFKRTSQINFAPIPYVSAAAGHKQQVPGDLLELFE